MTLPHGDVTKEISSTMYAEPATTWGPVFGYRWNNCPNRILRVARGEIVTDRHYRFNNYNQHCSFDYSPKKTSEHIYRFVVLGDAFTNDLLLHMAWPETLHHLLNSRKEFGIDFEVYSFPTDGGGLPNWHATFMALIDREFDYDALIIADWGNDLARNWAMIDSNTTQSRAIAVDPRNKPRTREQFEALLPQATVLPEIRSEEEIEARVRKLKKKADPQAVTPADCLDGRNGAELPPGNYQFSKEVFIQRYDEMRYGMLEGIINVCRDKDELVIYSCLPSLEGLICLQNDGKKLMAQAQGEGLCRHFDIQFFDGYEALRGIDSQSLVDFYWLKYDAHWNLGASMHYALKLADWIFQMKLFLRNPSEAVRRQS